MEPVNYYITTLTNAFKTLAPYAAFLIGGWFIFIKMPFLFLKKSMDDQKKKLEEENKNSELPVEKYSVENYLEFQRKLKLMNGEKEQDKKKEEPKAEKRTERKQQQTHQQSNQQRTREQQSSQKKEAPKRPQESVSQSPEEIFNFRPNESFSKSELKKRYFELLKQNHPDRVASMGTDFKKLAEKNTKEINKAYDKLKLKAS